MNTKPIIVKYLLIILIVQIALKLIGVEFNLQILNYTPILCVILLSVAGIIKIFEEVKYVVWSILFSIIPVVLGFSLVAILILWIHPSQINTFESPSGKEYSVVDRSFLMGSNIMIYKKMFILRYRTGIYIETDDSYNPIATGRYETKNKTNGFYILYNYDGLSDVYDHNVYVPY